MKTVSGKLISSKPISLGKSARILSKFVSTDNGASYSVQAYLRRTSVAFSELVQVHKQIKESDFNPKSDVSNLSTEKIEPSHHINTHKGSLEKDGDDELVKEDDIVRKRDKKSKKDKQKVEDFDDVRKKDKKLKKQKIEGLVGKEEDNLGVEYKEKNSKKKRKKSEGESDELGLDSAEQSSLKKKKKRKTEA